MLIRRFLVAAGLVCLTCGSADAQGAGKTGVTMGYPASIGIIWHATDKVAIRPELSIGGSSSSSSLAPLSGAGSPVNVSSDSLSLGTGVAVLFYLHTYDHLKTYFSPRLSYSRNTSNSENPAAISPKSKTTATTTGGTAAFGAQYGLGDRFSLFGELGFGVSYTKLTTTTSASKNTGNTWSTRSGVGVIFYF
jgi:hypothetical protein